MNAKIIERGNGLGGISVGTVLIDSEGEIVTVVALSTRIHTDGPRGNYLMATVEVGGDMTDAQVTNQHVMVEVAS
jgi:hypothetical protein